MHNKALQSVSVYPSHYNLPTNENSNTAAKDRSMSVPMSFLIIREKRNNILNKVDYFKVREIIVFSKISNPLRMFLMEF